MREYSIGEVAERMGVATSTIRFYDKHGLLPFVRRDDKGRRKFNEDDFTYLEVITVLKKSGVPVDIIGKFIDMCMQGDNTLEDRLKYLEEEENNIDKKISELNEQKEFLKFKEWYYRTAIEAGTENIHFTAGTRNFNPQVKQKYIDSNDVSPEFRRFL